MIREAIINQLKERKISQRKCSLDNEVDYINFNKFLKGQRSFW